MANIEQFDKIANSYESQLRVKLLELFTKEMLELGVCGDILDFGCGPGNLGISLASNCDMVCLLEPSKEMQKLIKQKIDGLEVDNCYIQSANLELGDELGKTFDYIIVAQVLLHIPDYKQLLSLLPKYLNKGGSIVIFDYLKNEEVYNETVHNGFELDQLIEILKNGGLSYKSDKVIYSDDNILLGSKGELFMLVMNK